MHLKLTHLVGGWGEKYIASHFLHHCSFYFESNKSTTSLILSLTETFKSEMNIFAAALKKHENLAVRFWHGLYFLFTLIYNLTSPISFQLCTNTGVIDMGK